jgi:hypothetical protein
MSDARLAPRPTASSTSGSTSGEALVPGAGAGLPLAPRGRPGPIAHIGLFRAFWNFMRDPNATLVGKTFIVAVFLYVVSPIDFVPELAMPMVGFLDDLGMAAIAAGYLATVLGPYRTAPGPVLPAKSDPPA